MAALNLRPKSDNESDMLSYNRITARKQVNSIDLVRRCRPPCRQFGVQVSQAIRRGRRITAKPLLFDDGGHVRLRTPSISWNCGGNIHLIVDDQHRRSNKPRDIHGRSRILFFRSAFTTPEQIAESIYHETVHCLRSCRARQQANSLADIVRARPLLIGLIERPDVFKLTDAQVGQLSITRERSEQAASDPLDAGGRIGWRRRPALRSSAAPTWKMKRASNAIHMPS